MSDHCYSDKVTNGQLKGMLFNKPAVTGLS